MTLTLERSTRYQVHYAIRPKTKVGTYDKIVARIGSYDAGLICMETVVGYDMATEAQMSKKEWLRYFPNGEYANICSVLVDSKFRGQRIATNMMRMAIQYIKRTGQTHILLDASPMELNVSLNMLIEFYGKMGFKVIRKCKANALMSMEISQT
jgi:ribosomal protein S18 acetylase RimI-like enzyme